MILMRTEISVTELQSVLDCPLCFWLAERIGPAPAIVAGITSQMDSVIKGFMKQFIGKSNLPNWFPVKGKFLDINKTLTATDPASGITLRGKLDALVQSPDKGYHIIDYKTGRPPREIPRYYQMQLDGYAYLLEHNGYGPVMGGFLLYFTPEPGNISESCFPFKITAVPAKTDSSRVLPVLAKARKILELERPPPRSEDCEMCLWLEQVGRVLSE
ncbi:MAG: PD-(D/E)XK nuclease family protein [Candidatus Hadarchaeum sp.]|uniref:PD-(D/E)XK nuclease family protein n=1 Tax=Candidatus Hadarchaeum sp. TaxID=2883567 RepID=UPI003D0B71D3